MKEFNLSEWLKDKSRKVVTRMGDPVRIVCWDSPNKVFPIVGFVGNESEIFTWDCFGYCREGHIETDFDLLFADDEEELTEFETAIYHDICTIITDCEGTIYDDKELKTIVKGIAKVLLGLVRKEILKDLPKWERNKPNEKYIHNKGWYLTWRELEKLPKEE